jgi:hypothetical protein
MNYKEMLAERTRTFESLEKFFPDSVPLFTKQYLKNCEETIDEMETLRLAMSEKFGYDVNPNEADKVVEALSRVAMSQMELENIDNEGIASVSVLFLEKNFGVDLPKIKSLALKTLNSLDDLTEDSDQDAEQDGEQDGD